tara:strand:+ start:555 stop:932 length:378 start_codon:yes stop_codon:yes gene_type:complete
MEDENEGIDLVFDPAYRELRDALAEQYFGPGKGKARDACLFAMAVGIKYNKRLSRDKWSGGKALSWDDLIRLSGRVGDFKILFDYMELSSEGLSTAELIAEFVTGGLQHIEQNGLHEEGNLIELA